MEFYFILILCNITNPRGEDVQSIWTSLCICMTNSLHFIWKTAFFVYDNRSSDELFIKNYKFTSTPPLLVTSLCQIQSACLEKIVDKKLAICTYGAYDVLFLTLMVLVSGAHMLLVFSVKFMIKFLLHIWQFVCFLKRLSIIHVTSKTC